jgi:hypothetical protein
MGPLDDSSDRMTISTASWNVAAINNNPFEFWVNLDDRSYIDFMLEVDKLFYDDAKDVLLHQIFTDDMFKEFHDRIQKAKILDSNQLDKSWRNDWRGRMAISEFIRDKDLCSKRLMSMPDRITNTLALADGSKCLRPSVINAYDGGDLSSIEAWWGQWLTFMFETPVRIAEVNDSYEATTSQPMLVCHLLTPLSRAKYPALTAEEEANSVALQLLCLALLDAVLVHVANAAGRTTWQPLRRALADALIRSKDERVCAVIADACADADVVFLQEASAALVAAARRHPILAARYALLPPRNLDARRNQNSLILVSRARFDAAGWADATADVLDMAEGRWVAPGDLVAASVAGLDGRRWLLVSFHGDSCGLMTQPILAAVDDAARARYAGHALLVGLDANPRSAAAGGGGWRGGGGAGGEGGEAGTLEDFLAGRGLASMWGSAAGGVVTTCSARTLLQARISLLSLL